MRSREVQTLTKENKSMSERVSVFERIVQALGITPDFPYFININDGANNRVRIGKLNGDIGIEISEAGVNVEEAEESELHFTSAYPVLKAAQYGQVSTTANVWYSVSHSLGYAPMYLVWAKGSGNNYRFIAPRRVVGSDPVGGIILVRAYSTTTHLKIITSANSEVYYYIFVDPL